jgi:hypothetical protein
LEIDFTGFKSTKVVHLHPYPIVKEYGIIENIIDYLSKIHRHSALKFSCILRHHTYIILNITLMKYIANHQLVRLFAFGIFSSLHNLTENKYHNTLFRHP